MHAFTKLQVVRQQFSNKELQRFHEQAVMATTHLKQSEAELIKALQVVDCYLVHRFIGYNSLFQYAVQALGLSEHQAYGFITVARKAKELPALQAAIESGEVTVSKVRKVTSVINEQNQTKWLELAKTSTRLELEKAVAEVNPKASIDEGARFVAENALDLRIAVTEETYHKLMRAKALQAQGAKNPSLDQVLNTALTQYLEKNDPVEKAKRAEKREQASGMVEACKVRGPGRVDSAKNGNARIRVTASLKHKINLRDQGKCQHKNHQGDLCNQMSWIDIHHIQAVSNGGTNEIRNLTTLCRSHHDLLHS